jgi:hypothetical protein
MVWVGALLTLGVGMTPLRAEEDPSTDTPPPAEIDVVFGEQTDEMFADLLNQLQADGPPDGNGMGIDPYAPCDLDWDHDCDEVDSRRFQAFLGRCKGDTGFTLAVSRADADRDDCITKADERELFPANPPAESP